MNQFPQFPIGFKPEGKSVSLTFKTPANVSEFLHYVKEKLDYNSLGPLMNDILFDVFTGRIGSEGNLHFSLSRDIREKESFIEKLQHELNELSKQNKYLETDVNRLSIAAKELAKIKAFNTFENANGLSHTANQPQTTANRGFEPSNRNFENSANHPSNHPANHPSNHPANHLQHGPQTGNMSGTIEDQSTFILSKNEVEAYVNSHIGQNENSTIPKTDYVRQLELKYEQGLQIIKKLNDEKEKLQNQLSCNEYAVDSFFEKVIETLKQPAYGIVFEKSEFENLFAYYRNEYTTNQLNNE